VCVLMWRPLSGKMRLFLIVIDRLWGALQKLYRCWNVGHLYR